MKTSGKIILILGAGAGVVLAGLLAFVLLLPRLVDLEQIKARAVAVVSEQTGAAVRFDRADFSYFPRPRVVITAVEAEWPDDAKIVIASLAIYPRLRSLLSGDLLIQKVLAESPELTMQSDFLDKPQAEDFDTRALRFLGRLSLLAPRPNLSLRSGTLTLVTSGGAALTLRKIDADMGIRGDETEIQARAETDFARSIAARLTLQRKFESFERISVEVSERNVDVGTARERGISLAGKVPLVRTIFSYLQGGNIPSVLFRSTAQSFRDLGKTENVVIEADLDRGTVFIPDHALQFSRVTGRCFIEKGILHGEGVEGQISGVRLRRGTLTIGLGSGDAPFHFSVDADASAGDTVHLIARFVKELPFPLDRLRDVRGTVKGRVTLGEDTASLRDWKNRGHLAFDGKVDLVDRLSIDLAMTVKPGGLALRRMRVHGGKSDATISLTRSGNALGLEFDGILAAETLAGVLEIPQIRGGAIRGHFNVSMDLESPSRSTMRGSLSAAGIAVPLKDGGLLAVERMNLVTEGTILRIESAFMKLEDNIFSVSGTITPGQQGLTVDADVSSERADPVLMKRLLLLRKPETPVAGKAVGPSLRVGGVIRFKAQRVVWDGFVMSPVNARLTLAQDSTDIDVAGASLCGIDLSGNASAVQGGVDARLVLRAKEQDLLHAVSCLTEQKSIYTGTYSVEGAVKATGPPEGLVSTLNGTLVFTARDGKISRAPLLAKIFSLLNVTEIFFGTIPDITTEGFEFSSISVKGDIRKGKIILKEAVIDGPTMKMVGSGKIDLASKTMDVELLAAPLRTIDRIVGAIPIIRQITGGSLIAVPVSVKGDLGNPSVQYLSLKGIGKGLLGMMERIITLPIRIFEPLIPKDQ